jgi:hypothetical protein
MQGLHLHQSEGDVVVLSDQLETIHALAFCMAPRKADERIQCCFKEELAARLFRLDSCKLLHTWKLP